MRRVDHGIAALPVVQPNSNCRGLGDLRLALREAEVGSLDKIESAQSAYLSVVLRFEMKGIWHQRVL